MSRKPPPITYNPSKDNYDFLIDKQAEYRKNDKSRGLDKIIDLILTDKRLNG
ncbi:unnamed protein product [marine sediment metagenome]|uniref:Uncharacterized protein n=1 Tax=marine sediment metagenome TaxID=412755 RepID=X1CR74_9ZZZZ